MSGLQYVGKNPDSDNTIITMAAADAVDQTLVVSTTYVNGIVSQKTTPLVDKDYIDQQDALRAHIFSVDLMDENYIPVSELGQPNGVATVDNFGNITAGQIPSTAITDRPTLYYEAASQGIIYLTPGNTHTVSSTANSREYRLASIMVPDPGYPWYPLCFGFVQGYAGGADPGRGHTNSNLGQLTVQAPQGISDTIYSSCIGTSDLVTNNYTLIPYAAAGAPATTPANHPPVTGSLQLDLYGSCYQGSSYTWSGTGLIYYIFVFPSM